MSGFEASRNDLAQAIERLNAGQWLPQELQARCANLKKAQTSLQHQIERLTQAYLAEVIALAEYQRRRAEIEGQLAALTVQERQLAAQARQQMDLVQLAQGTEAFCRRVRQGLETASFEHKRQLVELLIDRVVVSHDLVEIRYVIPTSPKGEQSHFCHLRIDYFDREIERKAKRRLNRVTESTVGQGQSMQVDGVAEVILRKVAPDALARYQAQIAQAKVPEPPVEKKQTVEQEAKRRRRRQIYQQYAAKYEEKSVYECDRLVVCELMSDLLTERGGQKLRDDEITKVGSILLQGPVAQQLRQTQGKEAGVTYAMEALAKARKVVENAQRRSRSQEMER